VRLDLADLSRNVERLRYEMRAGAPPPAAEVVLDSPAFASAAPRVSVVVPAFRQAHFLPGALDSARHDAAELIVVDDGADDDVEQVVRGWIDARPGVAVRLVRHPVNRGLGHARNTGLASARGELALALDADNELFPQAIDRLTEALDDDPGALFAYGMLQAFAGDESHGLRSVYPWDPRRLRVDNPIDALAMVRREPVLEMGAYTTERVLHGWEDQELWCRIAEGGGHGAFVPEILARYRVSGTSMGTITDLSMTAATAALIDRYPRLMAGAEPVP